jgi:hypothetical protein
MPRTRISAIPLPAGRVTGGHPVHVIDTANGIEIPINDARQILLHVGNDGPSVATVTIQGGDPALSLHGNGDSEHIQVAPLESRFIGPIDAAAFRQQGGIVWLDFTPETAGRISVYCLK